MKLQDLFQSGGQIQKLQNIETELLKRKLKGSIAGWGAVLSAVIQFTVIIADKELIKLLKTFSSFRELIFRPEFLPAVFIITGILLYILYRRTSLLLKESKEPFRYTFYVGPISAITNIPPFNLTGNGWLKAEDKSPDPGPAQKYQLKNENRLNLLQHDLTELINLRIKRFSVLEDLPVPSPAAVTPEKPATDTRKSSHIYIKGFYAVREDKQNNDWVIHVMPYVRIGATGSPSTLAQTVRFPLSDDTPETLDTEEYNQLLEKVYSRVTTEIYAQIESDIQNKIKLFPTSYLRANALFIEAQDFAASNTINAFECATRLYNAALSEIESTFINNVSRFFIGVPVLRGFFIPYIQQYATIQFGYAKCLLIKNRIEALSGRKGTPIFGIKHNIKPVVSLLEQYYSKVYVDTAYSPFFKNRKAFSVLTYLTFPADSWLRRILLKPGRLQFTETSRILFHAYVILSLTETLLGAFISSGKYLAMAKAIYPDMTSSDIMYLLAEAFLEPDIEKALIFFRQASEKDPDSQIARYFVAYWTEIKYFRNENIKPDSARTVLAEYDRTLRINPGSIAALVAQGYIFWLINDLSNARRRFQEGCNIKHIVGETFVGQLVYGLARITAEQGKLNESCELFRQAIASNPNTGAYYTQTELLSSNSFYDYCSRGLLRRYEKYYENFRFLEKNKFFPIGETDNKYLFDQKKIPLPDELKSIIIDLLRLHIGAISPESRMALNKHEFTDLMREELLGKKSGKSESSEIKDDIIDSILMLLWGKDFVIESIIDGEKWSIKGEKDQAVFLKRTDTKLIIGVRLNVDDRTLKTTLSYVLNDYGNANMNYFIRFGDEKKFRTAINNYNESIEKFPLNYVAKYNKAMALAYKGVNDETTSLLDEVIANNPSWIEALESYTNMMQKSVQKEIREKRKEIEDRRLILKKGGGGVLISPKDEKGDFRNREKETASTDEKMLQLINEKREIYTRLNILTNYIKEIFKNSKLNYLYEGMQLDRYEGLRIDEFLSLKLEWFRLNTADLTALRAYATVYNNAVSTSRENSIDTYRNMLISKKLFNHILRNFYPEDFNINLDKKNLIERMKKSPFYKEEDFINVLFETRAYQPVVSCLDSGSLPLEIKHLIIDQEGSFIEESLKVFKPDKNKYVVVWKVGNGKHKSIKLIVKGRTIIGYYSEADLCMMACESYIKYWLDLDHGNWNALKWAFELPREECKRLLCRAINDQNGDNPAVQDLLGIQYLNEGINDKAIKCFTSSVLLEPDNPNYRLDLGRAYSNAGDWNMALKSFREAVSLRKSQPEGEYGLEHDYKYMSEAYFKVGKLDDFINEFEKTGDLDDKDKPEPKASLYNRIGVVLADNGNTKEAITFYDKAVAVYSMAPIYYSNLGRAYSADGDWEKARDNFETAVKLRKVTPGDDYGLNYYFENLAEAYYKLDKIYEFVEEFKKCGELCNEQGMQASVYYSIGCLFSGDKNPYEAIQFFENALKLEDAKAVYHLKTGMEYASLKLWYKAYDLYKEAVRLRRNDQNDEHGLDYYYMYKAEASVNINRLNEFRNEFESSGDLCKDPSGRAAVYNRIGVILADKNRASEASQFYEWAIGLDESEPIYYCNLGKSFSVAGEWGKALTCHEKAVGLRRNDPDDDFEFTYYYEYLAEAYFKTDRIDEFIKNFEGSEDFDNIPSDKGQIYNWIGVLYSNSNQSEKAVDFFNKAVACDEKKTLFRSNMALTYLRYGVWDKSSKIFEEIIELKKNALEEFEKQDYYYESLAEAYFRLGKMDKFLEKYINSTALDGNRSQKASVLNRIGTLVFENEDDVDRVKKAMTWYEMAIDLDNSEPVYYANMGKAYSALGDQSKALSLNKKAVEVRRSKKGEDLWGLEFYLANLAESYFNLGKIDEFLSELEMSGDLLREEPKKALIYSAIAKWSFDHSNLSDALRFYLKAAGLDNTKALFQYNVGYVFLKLRKWDKAIPYLKKGLELKKIYTLDDGIGFETCYESYIQASSRIGRLMRFAREFETDRYLDNKPEIQAMVYNMLGNEFFRKGRLFKARKYYLKTIDLDKSKPVYFSNVGQSLSALSDWNKALGFYEKAVELRGRLADDAYPLEYYKDLLDKAKRKTGK